MNYERDMGLSVKNIFEKNKEMVIYMKNYLQVNETSAFNNKMYYTGFSGQRFPYFSPS